MANGEIDFICDGVDGKASVSRDSNADLTYVVYIFSENWSSDMVFCFLLGESDGR